MKYIVCFSLFIAVFTVHISCDVDIVDEDTSSLEVELDSSELVYPSNILFFSQDFYLAIRYEEPVDAYIDTLSKLDLKKLNKDLVNHDDKLSFWINIYNSLVQYKLLVDANSFRNMDEFFDTPDLILSGIPISLNEVEHGILRGKQSSNSIVQNFKLDKLDNRIHFTMNCGGSSCPAISYYKPESLEQDLADAEKIFCESTSSYDSVTNVLSVSELFDWFEEDFNGEEGILEIMKSNQIIVDSLTPTIQYIPYNWDLKSKKYK